MLLGEPSWACLIFMFMLKGVLVGLHTHVLGPISLSLSLAPSAINVLHLIDLFHVIILHLHNFYFLVDMTLILMDIMWPIS